MGRSSSATFSKTLGVCWPFKRFLAITWHIKQRAAFSMSFLFLSASWVQLIKWIMGCFESLLIRNCYSQTTKKNHTSTFLFCPVCLVLDLEHGGRHEVFYPQSRFNTRKLQCMLSFHFHLPLGKWQGNLHEKINSPKRVLLILMGPKQWCSITTNLRSYRTDASCPMPKYNHIYFK